MGNNIVDSSKSQSVECEKDSDTETYSPVRHLASVAFPFYYKYKYMLMLTAYLDETGSSGDLRQKFVGMAGLLAKSKDWEKFEKNWKSTLKNYNIPYFHMKDFAQSRGFFEGWKEDETKRRKLLGELMQAIRQAKALPFGSTIPMEFYRQHPQYLQNSVKNPYYLAFMFCSRILSEIMEPYRIYGETIATVFAEQTEFQNRAIKGYERLKNSGVISDLMDSPIFRPMQKLVPLQAADLVAYEAHKEADRSVYRPNDKPRWGWTELVDIARNRANFEPFKLLSEQNVTDTMIGIKKSIEFTILGRIKQ